MKIEDLEVGMKVVISNDISITDRRHQSNSEMYRMRGQTVTVKFIDKNSVMIGNYRWAPEDLKELEPRKVEPQIFHFDESFL